MKANFVMYFVLALFAAGVGSLITLVLSDSSRQSYVAGTRTSQSVPADAATVAQAEQGTPTDAAPSSEVGVNTEVFDLQQMQQEIQNATLERAQLAETISQLNRQLESLESDLINQSLIVTPADLTTGVDALSTEDEVLDSASVFGRGPTRPDRFNSLLAAGVDQQMATELQARQDQFQLSRLELFDQAQREGWIDTDEFAGRLEDLEGQQVDLRSELGDTAYDRYLFELGRSNRVVVSSVINGSAAQIAGIQSGDMIVTYANERVFSTSDLQSATRSGLRGEMVIVNFERNGSMQSTQMPRGPLGVTLRTSSREPS